MKILLAGVLLWVTAAATAQKADSTQTLPDSIQKLQRKSVAVVVTIVPEALGGSLSVLFGAKYLRGWYNRPQELPGGQSIPKTPWELQHNHNTGIALTAGGCLLLAGVVASGILASHFHTQYIKQTGKLKLQTGLLDSGNLDLALNF